MRRRQLKRLDAPGTSFQEADFSAGAPPCGDEMIGIEEASCARLRANPRQPMETPRAAFWARGNRSRPPSRPDGDSLRAEPVERSAPSRTRGRWRGGSNRRASICRGRSHRLRGGRIPPAAGLHTSGSEGHARQRNRGLLEHEHRWFSSEDHRRHGRAGESQLRGGRSDRDGRDELTPRERAPPGPRSSRARRSAGQSAARDPPRGRLSEAHGGYAGAEASASRPYRHRVQEDAHGSL